MMKNTKIYLLEVLDNYDKYSYCTLVFTSKEDLNKAVETIKQFDEDWYNGLDEESLSGSYYEDLIDLLESKGLFNRPDFYDTIYVR